MGDREAGPEDAMKTIAFGDQSKGQWWSGVTVTCDGNCGFIGLTEKHDDTRATNWMGVFRDGDSDFEEARYSCPNCGSLIRIKRK